MEEIPSNLHRMDAWTRGWTLLYRLLDYLLPSRRAWSLLGVKQKSKQSEHGALRKKAFWISHSSCMLYLTRAQSSSYHLSLLRGTRFCTQLLWGHFSDQTPFHRGYEEMNDNSNCLESSSSVTWLSNGAPEDYTLVSVPCQRRPAWPRSAGVVVCQFSAVTAAPEDLFHIATPFDCVPLPSSWPRTFIFVIGKSARAEEADARGSRSAGCDLWAFLWRNHRNLRWFQLTEEEKKSVGFDFYFTPSGLYPSFFGPRTLFGKPELDSRYIFRLGNVM